MSGQTCADCGELYAPGLDPSLCPWCRAEDNRFRTRMAKLVEAERHGELNSAGDVDLEELRRERDRLRPLAMLKAANEPNDGGRVVRYWVGDSRHGALRTMVVPGPVKTDPWGKPLR